MQGYVPGLLVCQVRLALVHRGLDEAGSPVHLMHARPTVVGTRPHSDGKPTRQRDGTRTMLSTCQAHHPPLHLYSTVSSASTQSANSLTFYRRAQPRSPSMSLSQGFSIKRKLPTTPTYHYQISKVLNFREGICATINLPGHSLSLLPYCLASQTPLQQMPRSINESQNTNRSAPTTSAPNDTWNATGLPAAIRQLMR